MYADHTHTNRNYLEELFVFAHQTDIPVIANQVQAEFMKIKNGMSNQIVSIHPLLEDEMGVKQHWQEQYGENTDPVDHVLSVIKYRFTLRGEHAPDLDAVSMDMYQAVRNTIRKFSAVEYFSMFSEDSGPKG